MKPRAVLVQCSQVSLTLSVRKSCLGQTCIPPTTYSTIFLIQEFEDLYLNSLCFWQPRRKKCHCRNNICLQFLVKGLVTRWILQHRQQAGETPAEKESSHCLQSGQWSSESKMWRGRGRGQGIGEWLMLLLPIIIIIIVNNQTWHTYISCSFLLPLKNSLFGRETDKKMLE